MGVFFSRSEELEFDRTRPFPEILDPGVEVPEPAGSGSNELTFEP